MDKKNKILIIDDNQEFARSFGIFLMQQGYEIGLSANSYESVEVILANSSPDLVLIERFINGNEIETNRIAAFIDKKYQLPIVFISQNKNIQSCFLPSINHLYIPHPAIDSHYLAHVIVGMDNLLHPGIILKNIRQIIELNVAIVPLLTNGEPKFLTKKDIHYSFREINLLEIPLVRSNNNGSRNTCLFWEQNNHDFCLQENISMLNLAKRHKDAHFIRVSKFEMVMLSKIQSYELHHTVTVDNHKVDIGKGYKKIIDAILLSIPRLNCK